MFCSTSCCGDSYNRYCCYSNVGLIVGIVLGVIGLVATVVTVLVVVFCCCRKSRGQTGQVCQPACVTTTTVPVYGVQATTVTQGYGPGYGPGYGQVGYTNAAFPQQMQTSNLSADNAQKWEQLPPAYSTVNPN